MRIAQSEIVSLFKWYQCPTSLDKQVILPEEFLGYHRLDIIYLSYCLGNDIQNRASEDLLKKQEEVKAKYSIYRDIAKELSSRLQKASIHHVFLKGIALAGDIYLEPWHRYFSDLDLLVDKSHLLVVEDILKSMGYQYGFYSKTKKKICHPTRAEILFQKTYTHEMYNMCRIEKDNLVSNIDVNFLFTWRGILSNKTHTVSDFLDHIVLRRGIPVLDNTANMIHLCCHLFNEANFFALDRNYEGGDPKELLLIRVFDIALLASRLSGEEFNSLVKLAQKMNCIDKVVYSLGLTNLLLNLDIGHGIDALGIESGEMYAGYYGKDQQYHTWPISIYDRVFDLEKKREVSETVFPSLETR